MSLTKGQESEQSIVERANAIQKKKKEKTKFPKKPSVDDDDSIVSVVCIFTASYMYLNASVKLSFVSRVA